MKILRNATPEFEEHLSWVLQRRQRLFDELSLEVEAAIHQYRMRGEDFLIDYARHFDNVELQEKDLWIENDRIKGSHKLLSSEVRHAIEHAKDRVERFQSELKLPSFEAEEESGVLWGTEIRPLDRVGIYVPGGKANYFMTLLLCAVPAQMAGVKEMIVATPPKQKLGPPYIDPTLLYTAKLFEIPRILVSGGIAGISALCFGTKSSEPVQKIVGSGGRHTAVAKSKLSGLVGTDNLSGPSETAFICNKTSSITNIAADLIGRADRDYDAQFYVLSTDPDWVQKLVEALAHEVEKLTDPESRRGVQACLERNTSCFIIKNVEQGIEIANRLAPGTLCLAIEDASDYISQIKACGSLLLGHFTPPVGLDMIGGPSGLVSTMGSATYSVSMSPGSFVRRFSVLELGKSALEKFLRESVELSKQEGFLTHESSYNARFE